MTITAQSCVSVDLARTIHCIKTGWPKAGWTGLVAKVIQQQANYPPPFPQD
ncbi:hypothetical protein [Lyngbya confervoides]|uniref:Transposase n=1 Tax=Lyngbya confervoides BDU141951 TaxID=1574623 RepID=A0ABD4T2V1_9CYAN|nr:hypothetical protein [Lyngbya confervoides]MCM1983091.1 hypothetical protein [Lyngbya confervoides BDU141951]